MAYVTNRLQKDERWQRHLLGDWPDRMASDEEIRALPKYLTLVTVGALIRTEPGFFAFWNNHCIAELGLGVTYSGVGQSWQREFQLLFYQIKNSSTVIPNLSSDPLLAPCTVINPTLLTFFIACRTLYNAATSSLMTNAVDIMCGARTLHTTKPVSYVVRKSWKELNKYCLRNIYGIRYFYQKHPAIYEVMLFSFIVVCINGFFISLPARVVQGKSHHPPCRHMIMQQRTNGTALPESAKAIYGITNVKESRFALISFTWCFPNAHEEVL